MHTFLQLLLEGILSGAVIGLLAMPFNIAYATTKSFDTAVGGYAVVSGMAVHEYGLGRGVPIGLASGVLGSLIMAGTFLVLRKRHQADPIIVVLASFGVLFALISFAYWRYGGDEVYKQLLGGTVDIGGIRLVTTSVLGLGVALVVLIALWVLLRWSALGRLMRASADDAHHAEITGIPVTWVQVGAFIVSGLLAAVGGIFAVGTSGIGTDLGASLTIQAFGAVIIAGARGPGSSLVSAMVIGMVTAFATGYSSGGLADIVTPAFIFIVLASGRLDFAKGNVRRA